MSRPAVIGLLVRLPSGKTCGAELTRDQERLIPHGVFCDCARCEPTIYAAAPELLRALRGLIALHEQRDRLRNQTWEDVRVDEARRVLAAIEAVNS